MKHLSISRKRFRTTIDLPENLLERADAVVKQGMARSRNALVEKALTHYLDGLEQKWIDEQFAAMEHDERYKALNLQMMEEFEESDWEALRISGGKKEVKFI